MPLASDKVKAIFLAALDRANSADRAAYLDEACAADASLRPRVEALLRAHDQRDYFLDRPAAQLSAAEWTAATTREPEQAGATIAGRYRLLEPVGEGGMGTVWLAEQTQPVRRRVALKLIKPGLGSKAVLARFEAERQALALMDHPNIARVLDGGTTEGGRPFFVMEYVRGVPLNQYCDGNRLGVHERLALFVSVCQAVQHAHQKGIIHRDLKPSNLLVFALDGAPVPKVIDFGLAKALHEPLTENPQETAHGVLLGTPLYMSPEQAEFHNPDVDTRADVYALGVILYELLTGTTPLEKDRIKDTPWPDVVRRIKEEEPPPPSARVGRAAPPPGVARVLPAEPRRLAKLLRGELDWIVLKCLEKDRSRRYETANALARDVQRYLADEVVEARPPGTAYRLRKWLRKHRGPVVAGGLVLLALLGGIAAAGWGLVRANEALAGEAAQRQEAEGQRGEAEQQRDRAVKAEKLARKRLGEANAERATAQAVNDFLRKSLLGQADVANQPFGAGWPERNPKVTVRELLDRAAATLEGQFAGQPLTEAAVRQTLGDTYQGLGAYDQARGHAERAVALRTAHLGADHPDTLSSKHNLARLYHEQGQRDRAEPLFQEVLRGLTARLGADHLETLGCKNNLGVVAHEQGKYDLAESIYREVLLGRTAQLGADHPDTLASKNNLAGLYRARGKYALAEPLYLEVTRGLKDLLGADHPHTLAAKGNLALLYQAQRKYDRAESLLLETLQTQTARLEPDHPTTLVTKSNLALLYQTLRKFDRAEPLYLEVVQARTAKLGADHPRTLTTKHNLAVLYAHTNRAQQSLTLLEEVLQGRQRHQADHPDTVSVGLSLAALHFKLGQLARAEALIDAWLPRGQAGVGLDHPMTQTGAQTALAIYGKTKQPAKAEPLLRDLVAFWKTKAGADSSPYAYHLSLLGDVLLRQRKWADAERALRESLAVREKTEPDSWTTFYNRSSLGVALAGLKRFDEAGKLLAAGGEGLKQRATTIPPQSRSCLTEALQWAIRHFEAVREPEEAARWRKELEKLSPP